jgi:hypothetical protein
MMMSWVISAPATHYLVVTLPMPLRDSKAIPSYYNTVEWRDLRRSVLRRDRGTCQYCGGSAVTADHVVPRERGGPDHPDNLVAACALCNELAGGSVFRSVAEKRLWIKKVRRGDDVSRPRPDPMPIRGSSRKTPPTVVEKRRLTGWRKTLALKNMPDHVRDAVTLSVRSEENS